eukprot:gnl/TRDRNA2_/TRDRNA2_148499_c0_seq2.p1 gnl/TRDRNA2_/TRDRNA2_148499_c0~~gnl/TRDRNA2_/TRDRNA2_148499_c0_seq2.p1  ORF type:complete len:293 (-),score=40.27 gnl/TRDRNA2_/TRDRNA2_148499_c0_seq2:643-1521(-)
MMSDRALKPRSLHRTDLENTTLEKGLQHPNPLARPRVRPAALPQLASTFMRSQSCDRSIKMCSTYGTFPRVSSAARSVKVAALPWPFGATIKQATEEQLMPQSSDQVLNDVAALCTEAIFAPATEKLSKSVQATIYTSLTDNFRPSGGRESALFLAFNGKSEVVGCVGVDMTALTPDGRSMGGGIQNRPLLQLLSVDSSTRGKGIGKSLIRRVEDKVRDWGYDEVFLQVEAENVAAIRLYKKMGFKVTADGLMERPWRAGLFGGMSMRPTPHLSMRKELGGILGLKFPKLFR